MTRLHTPHPRATAAALACSLLLLASHATAHIELQLPMGRYSNVRSGANEACPCGAGTMNRRCNDPTTFSDGSRSPDRVTTFAPGETITVRFSEYVGHEGRYRIAFDPDGAELSDFNQHVLLDEPDPRGAGGNLGEGTTWELQVTLPDMTCDNCTLQLLQVIDGNTTEPVLDPSTRGETYFQCADIALREGTPAGGTPPVSPRAHLAELSRPARTPMATEGGGAPQPEQDAGARAALAGATGDASSESSCALRSGTPAHDSLPLLALLGVSLALLQRCRGGDRCSRS